MRELICDLKNAINESSQMIANQLQGVESSLLGAFISVIMSAFISNSLGLLKYWLPASFILMWIILAFSLITNILPKKKPKITKSADEAQTVMNSKLPSPRINMVLYTIKLKNSVPFFNSIGIVFFISFLSLIASRLDIIELESKSSTVVPIIATLVFMSLPLTLHWVINKLEKIDFKLDISKLGCFSIFIIFIPALLFAFSLLVLPIWSLVISLPNYQLSCNTFLSIIVVMFLQSFTALTFINYFSASLVKKEMTIALFNLSYIRNRLHDLEPYQPISEDTYKDLLNNYAKAKRYEMSADNSLLVNFYSLALNQTYLANLLEENSNTSDSDQQRKREKQNEV